MGPEKEFEARERLSRWGRRWIEGGTVPERLRLERSTARTTWEMGSQVMKGQEQWWVEEFQELRKREGSEVMEAFRERRTWYSEMGCEGVGEGG